MTRKAGPQNSNTLKLLAVVTMICQHVTISSSPPPIPGTILCSASAPIHAHYGLFHRRGIITAAESTWSCCCCITASGAARASGTGEAHLIYP